MQQRPRYPDTLVSMYQYYHCLLYELAKGNFCYLMVRRWVTRILHWIVRLNICLLNNDVVLRWILILLLIWHCLNRNAHWDRVHHRLILNVSHCSGHRCWNGDLWLWCGLDLVQIR